MKKSNFLGYLNQVSFYAIIAYIVVLSIHSFNDWNFVYYNYVDSALKGFFICEVLIRILILRKKFFTDKIQLLDLTLLIISFIPSYEMLRATRLFTHFLKKPEMKKMLLALKRARKEILDWGMIVVALTVLLSLFLEHQLGIKYPVFWENMGLSLKSLIQVFILIENEDFYTSITEIWWIPFLIIGYFSFGLGAIWSIVNAVLIAHRQHIDSEEFELHLQGDEITPEQYLKKSREGIKVCSTVQAEEILKNSDFQAIILEKGPWSEAKSYLEGKLFKALGVLVPVECIESIYTTQHEHTLCIKLMGEGHIVIPVEMNISETLSFKKMFFDYVTIRYGKNYLKGSLSI